MSILLTYSLVHELNFFIFYLTTVSISLESLSDTRKGNLYDLNKLVERTERAKLLSSSNQ